MDIVSPRKAFSFSDRIEKDQDVVTETSQQDQDVEDLMFTPFLTEAESEGVENTSDRIEDASGKQP